MTIIIDAYRFDGLRTIPIMLAEYQSIRNVSTYLSGNRYLTDAFFNQLNVDAADSVNENYIGNQVEVATTVAKIQLTADDSNNTSWTWVTVIPAGSIMKSGNKVRFKLSAHSTNGSTYTAYFGQQDPAGDAFDFLAGNKIQITYQGSGTIVIPAGAGEVWSDPITYTLDNTKNHIFACSPSAGFARRHALTTATAEGWIGYQRNIGGDAATDNKTGYVTGSFIKNMSEVQVLENDYPRPDAQYKNTGGYGNRTGSITVTTNVAWDSPYNVPSAIVDGDIATFALDYPNAGASAGQYLRFDFITKKYINEFTSITINGGSGSTWGTWKWQGSDTASVWTDVSPLFEWLSDSATRYYALNPRSEGYRYYQLVCVTPGIGNDFLTEVNFKIADGAVQIGAYYEPTTFATVPTGVSSPVSGQGSGGASDLNERYVIPYTQLSAGKKGRISFNGGANIYRLSGAAIGLKSTSGDPSDFDQNSMVEITFNGGDKRRDAPANTGVWYSDVFDFDFDFAIANARDIVISFANEVATNKGDTFTGSGVNGYRVTGAVNYNLGNAAAGSAISQQRYFFNSLEILRPNNMDVISEPLAVPYSPNKARVIFTFDDIDTATINTDYEGYVSRDDGANWVEIPSYTAGGSAGVGSNIEYFYGDVDFVTAGVPSGTNLRTMFRTKNNKNVRNMGNSISAY